MEFIDLRNTNKLEELPKPPGLQTTIENFENGSISDKKAILLKKAWSLAISPFSNVFVYLIMFYFLGSHLNIYTLIMFFGLAINHIKNITSLNSKFKAFEQYKFSELGFYKLIFVMINIGVLLFIGYKLYNLGLLPLSPGDYVDILPINQRIAKVGIKIIK